MAVTYSYLAGVGCHLIILVDRSVCEENLIHAASLHQHMFQFHWLLIDSHSEARGQLSGRAQLTPSHLFKMKIRLRQFSAPIADLCKYMKFLDRVMKFHEFEN